MRETCSGYDKTPFFLQSKNSQDGHEKSATSRRHGFNLENRLAWFMISTVKRWFGELEPSSFGLCGCQVPLLGAPTFHHTGKVQLSALSQVAYVKEWPPPALILSTTNPLSRSALSQLPDSVNKSINGNICVPKAAKLRFNPSSTRQEGRWSAAAWVPQIRHDPWKPNTMLHRNRGYRCFCGFMPLVRMPS